MMTGSLHDLIARAVERRDGRAARLAAARMRLSGWNYARSFRAVQVVCPRVTVAEWDELLREDEDAED